MLRAASASRYSSRLLFQNLLDAGVHVSKKIHLETDGDFRWRRYRSKPRVWSLLNRYKDFLAEGMGSLSNLVRQAQASHESVSHMENESESSSAHSKPKHATQCLTPATTSPELLRQLPDSMRPTAMIIENPIDACRSALVLVSPGGTLVVCGSFFLAAETRDWFRVSWAVQIRASGGPENTSPQREQVNTSSDVPRRRRSRPAARNRANVPVHRTARSSKRPDPFDLSGCHDSERGTTHLLHRRVVIWAFTKSITTQTKSNQIKEA